MLERETIAAIATGLTDSGIGIIRISGDNAINIGDSLFRTSSGKKVLSKVNSHTVNYGFIIDENSNHIIDEVMAIVMKAPRSFTGENVVEIQCHGGVLVMKKILSIVLKSGARLADPGEFTKRAFLNGRIDLTKAEAVMDIIQSQNEYALESSVNQLRGNLSEEIKRLRSDIIYEIAFIESALDDPEHISLDGYYLKLEDKLNGLIQSLTKLISTSDSGKLIKEGINTVIVGKPNAGKSSFMNLLVGEETAIVTDIAGTTRDVLKESIRLDDIHFNIVDTAGIRETEDIVERIGVDKAKKYALDADLILYVVDTSRPIDSSDKEIVSILDNKNVIILLNKSDLKAEINDDDIKKLLSESSVLIKNISFVKISAKNSVGLDEFQKIVKEMFFHGEIQIKSEIMITNMRHKEALQNALDSLLMVKKSIEDDMPEDFLSIDLMSAYASLGRIIGEEVDDDLVEEIFSKFCMGK